MPEITEYEFGTPPVDVTLKIAGLISRVWPASGTDLDSLALRYLTYSPDLPDVRSFVMMDGAELLAHARTFTRVIHHSAGEIRAMALAMVCVCPEHQGKGFGARIVSETFKQVDREDYPMALFQTEVRGFYIRLGAVEVTNPFVNNLTAPPDKSPWWDPHVMIYPALNDWPEGEIDLNGKGY